MSETALLKITLPARALEILRALGGPRMEQPRTTIVRLILAEAERIDAVHPGGAKR